jgi:hypothetical protein
VELPRVSDPKTRDVASDLVLHTPSARRVVAGLIDLAIAYSVFAYILLLLSRRFPVGRALLILGGALVLLIPNPYLLLKDTFQGKSIGKVITGLVAYNEEERRAGGLKDSVLRNWYLGVPLVGPTVLAVVMGMQILAGRPLRLGDASAHMRVITDLDYQRVR